MSTQITDHIRARGLMRPDESRWHIVIGALVLMLVFDLLALAVYVMPPKYTAESVVAIRPVQTAETSTDDLKLIANELAVYLSNQSIQDYVSSDSADSSFDVRVDPDTATVRISATTSSPAQSINAADRLAELAQSKATDRATTDSLSQASDNPLGEGPPRLMFLAAALAMTIGLGATLLIMRRPEA